MREKKGDMSRTARVGNNGQNGENSNLPARLANILMRQQRENSHFGKKGIYLANIRQSLINIQMRWSPLHVKLPILKKLANLAKIIEMAKIRQSLWKK